MANYVDPAELIREIVASRLTFCSDAHEHYRVPAYIADSQAALADVQDGLEDGQDVIVRVYTDEHLVHSGMRIDVLNEMRLRMRPFKHYVVTSQGHFEVLYSHWKGTIEDGECAFEGQLTDRLGAIIYEMCKRYGTRREFRNYRILDDMVGEAVLHLIRIVLKVDEYRTDSQGRNAANAFSFLTSCIHRKFIEVIDRSKRQMNRDRKMLDPKDIKETEGEVALREYESAEQAWEKFKKANPDAMSGTDFDSEEFSRKHLDGKATLDVG